MSQFQVCDYFLMAQPRTSHGNHEAVPFHPDGVTGKSGVEDTQDDRPSNRVSDHNGELEGQSAGELVELGLPFDFGAVEELVIDDHHYYYYQWE